MRSISKRRFRFSVLSVALVAASALTVLAVGQPAAQAASLSAQQTAAIPARQAAAIPATEVSEPFNLNVVDGCGTWSGTLSISVQGVYFYGDVTGTMHAGCNGGSTGHFWYTCGGGTGQNPKTWTTESSTSTDYGMGPCVYGPLVIWTELCYQGPARYACANSAKLEFD